MFKEIRYLDAHLCNCHFQLLDQLLWIYHALFYKLYLFDLSQLLSLYSTAMFQANKLGVQEIGVTCQS